LNALTLNDPFLDTLFSTGFPLGKIIQVYGRGGTCKSTFAFQVSARFGALKKKAFFIDSTLNFNKKRFTDIAGNNKTIFEHILLTTPRNLWEQTILIDTISKLGTNISLICVDTISSFLRPYPINKQKRTRNIQLLTYQLAALTQICEMNNCSVILINQATFRDFNTNQEVPFAERFINRYTDILIHLTRESEGDRGVRIIIPSSFDKKSYFSIEKKGLCPQN